MIFILLRANALQLFPKPCLFHASHYVQQVLHGDFQPELAIYVRLEVLEGLR